MEHAGTYWRVRGARRDSGEDTEVLVRAADRAGAEREAQRLGILTSRIEQVPMHEAARPGASHAPEGGPPGPGTERLVRIYATRPRDHLYVGWALRHRRQVVVTSHRIVLHERLLLATRTSALDIGAVDGASVGRVVRWRVLLGTLLLAISGLDGMRLLYERGTSHAIAGLIVFGTLVLLGLLLSRADSVGVTSASGPLRLVRYGVPPEVRERFLSDVHSVLRDGTDRELLSQIMAQSLQADGRLCPACRYPLVGLEHATVCPECGAQLPGAGAA